MNEAAEQELVKTVQALIQNNLRYEVLIRAIAEVLGTKKQADGTPLMTVDELNASAENIKKQIIASGQAQAEAAAKAAADAAAGVKEGVVVPPNA